MRLILVLIAGLIASPCAFTQEMVILDEGYNTQQPLTIPTNRRGRQGCVSIETTMDSSNSFVSGSLCNPVTSSFELGANASEYRNRVTYEFTAPNGAVTDTFNITVRGTFNNVERGNHGNLVSNAGNDFDNTLTHQLWQVFGIERRNNRNTWVSVANPQSQTPAGETIQAALDQLGVFSQDPSFNNSNLRNVGAINMSLGAGGGELSDLKCNGDGQASVDLLAGLGIAVVVGLQNVDVPSDQETWPACLNGVIKVGGESAFSSTAGTRRIGVGANGGIDFFAQDRSGNNIGNSFAAPRIASAYAKLHELFPRSSVQDKTNALRFATDGREDTYRTRLVDNSFFTHRAPKLRSGDMARAIDFLSISFPPQDNSSVELDINDSSVYGPFFDAPSQSYNRFFNFQDLVPAPKLSLKAGTGVLSPRRDVELKFTSVYQSGNLSTNFFRLLLNGSFLQFTQASFGDSTPRQQTIIINRNLLNEGENQIVLDPSSIATWGLRDISIRYLPAVPLQLGANNPTVYGYEQNPTRFTGLRATFDLPSGEIVPYKLSATGFDIDRADETEVFVNGNFLGRLNAGPSTAFSTPNSFSLAPEILRVGRNFIEFVQRRPQVGVWEGFQDEKWAVRNITVSPDLSADTAGIVPVIMMLLDDDTSPPTP